MSDPSHRFADVESLDGLEIDADDIEAVLEQILPVQEQRTVDIRKALAAAVVLDD